MKKLFSLISVLALLICCVTAVAEETEDMRDFYNPQGYDLLFVSDVFIGEGEDQIVQGCFGTIDMTNGEDQMEFIGFDREEICSFAFAEGAVIEMPEDLMNPVENSPIATFEDLDAWFDGFMEAYPDAEGFYATFEMNADGELTALSYCYLP